MAIFHLSVKTISRSAGRTATAAAAYRAGVEITDERIGDVHDYRRKGGIESAELVLPAEAPEWASDRNAVWNAAEQAETRKNSTVAREFEIALPSELSATERQRLARDFAREIVDRHGCVADVCIHAPDRGGDNRNHHAHILLTTRRLKASGFTEKTRELDDRKTKEVDRWRARFASLQNERLLKAGQSVQVDHRRLIEQGIDRAPTKHLGPAATGIERRTGEPSRRRLDFEAEVAERLRRAREAGESERQAKALDSAILDLTSTLQQAKRQRDAQQAQVVEAKAQAQQAEQRWIDRMSAAELQAEVTRVRPLPVPDLVERDLRVIAAKQRWEALQAEVEQAKAIELQLQRETYAWRQAHPVRAKLHDMGLASSSFLVAQQREVLEARQNWYVAGPQAGRAEQDVDFARSVARDRVAIDTAPARAQAAELEKLAQIKAIQERVAAAQLKADERQRDETAKVLVLAAKLQREGKFKTHHPEVQRTLEFIGTLPGGDTARQVHLRQVLKDPQRKQMLLSVVQSVLPQLEAQQERGRGMDRELDRGRSR